MRIIIRELLEPTIKRQEEDRYDINCFRRIIEQFQTRLDEMD